MDNSLNNVTARSSDEETFQSRKQSSTHEKSVFSWKQNKICFSNIFDPSLMALMAFAETETKVVKTLLPLVHSRHVKVSWRRGDTLLQQHRRHTLGSFQMPTHTLELSTVKENAKTVRSYVVKGATSDMTALDMPSLHSSACESTTMAVTFCASVPT